MDGSSTARLCRSDALLVSPPHRLALLFQLSIASLVSVDRVSVERVCSGLGLPKIYEYLSLQRPQDGNAAVAALIKSGKEDVGKVIAESAKSGKVAARRQREQIALGTSIGIIERAQATADLLFVCGHHRSPPFVFVCPRAVASSVSFSVSSLRADDGSVRELLRRGGRQSLPQDPSLRRSLHRRRHRGQEHGGHAQEPAVR